ncbi:MAG: hypothetical protein U5L45_08455 [Saprospiraceae bacterium]|nr:hypothetical protein [Saprospiraceae bacterium]
MWFVFRLRRKTNHVSSLLRERSERGLSNYKKFNFEKVTKQTCFKSVYKPFSFYKFENRNYLAEEWA